MPRNTSPSPSRASIVSFVRMFLTPKEGQGNDSLLLHNEPPCPSSSTKKSSFIGLLCSSLIIPFSLENLDHPFKSTLLVFQVQAFSAAQVMVDRMHVKYPDSLLAKRACEPVSKAVAVHWRRGEADIQVLRLQLCGQQRLLELALGTAYEVADQDFLAVLN